MTPTDDSAPAPAPVVVHHPAASGIRLNHLREVAEFNNVFEGTVATDQPPVWRHMGMPEELAVPAARGLKSWNASQGGFTARALEGDTQFAETRQQAIAWSHPMRRESADHHLLVEVDISSLPVRFIANLDTRAPNLQREGGNATMFPDTGLGIGVLGDIPVDRIRSILVLHPNARTESLAESRIYLGWDEYASTVTD